MDLLSELTHKTDDKSMKMTWEELKHEINLEIVNFRRWNAEKPNTIILGKKECRIFRGDDACVELSRGQDEGALLGKSTDDVFVDGEPAQIWSLRICRVEEDSMVKAGYVM